jgi:uncharacterized protein involved in exopolysaccharide biosynthesis
MANDILQGSVIKTEASGNGHDSSFLVDEKILRARSDARWQLVWDSRKLILRVTAWGLLVSLVIAFLIPTRFQSTARLMPPDQGSSAGMGMAMLAATSISGNLTSQLGPGLGSVAGDLFGLKNSSDLFIGVLRSRTVEDDLINKFNLRKVYLDRRIEDARLDLEDRTDLDADRKSGIITIRVLDHDPKRAAAMAGEYVSELNQVVTVLNTSSAHRERVFLEGRLTEVKSDLETAEKNFSAFASKNTTIDLQAQAKAMIEAGAALEGQLIAARTELQGLRQIYSDNNVRVRALQARVDEIQRQIQKIGGKYDENPNSAAQSAEGDQSLYPSIRKLPLIGVSYADLYRNTKVEESLFEVLTKEYELAKVQEAKETPSVKVLDPPDIPEKKYFPPRLLITLLGALIAMCACVGFVFARARWDATDDGDTRKIIAKEAYGAVRKRMSWTTTNGAGHTDQHSVAP